MSYSRQEETQRAYIDLEQINASIETNNSMVKVTPEQYDELVLARINSPETLFPNIEIIDHKGPNKTQLYMKRLMDILIAIDGLLLLALIYPIMSICIKINSPGKVLYNQDRIGHHGETIKIWKFRTMKPDAEKQTGPVWAKEKDDRVTCVGNFLRKTRLDELPQLYNVLKGDMSFIGPRPERAYFINLLKDEFPYYIRRLQIKPGITGWAQIHVNYDRNIDDVIAKLQHDEYYINNMSIILDIKIILKTFKTVFGRKGAH